MGVVIVTGSGGLVGSQTVEHFVRMGRPRDWAGERHAGGVLRAPTRRHIRSRSGLPRACRSPRRSGSTSATRTGCDGYSHARGQVRLVVHAAAQPSHDWAASDPRTDFGVNAQGTLNLLEATREHAPDAPFIFLSTNKVYGDRPNFLPLEEHETRLELPEDHGYFEGIDTSMSIDGCLHSLFGVSKAA